MRILAPVDFSEASRRGLSYAFGAAGAYGAPVEVLHACSLPPYVPATLALSLARGEAPTTVQELAFGQAKEEMARMLAAVPHPSCTPELRVQPGDALDAILERSRDAQLVVMGTHGRTGLDRIFIGSVAEKVVRSSATPVITVHRDSDASFPPRKILVGIDFSGGSRAALRMSAEMARRFGSELHVVHVIAGIPSLGETEILVITTAQGAPEPYYELARSRAAAEMRDFLAGEVEIEASRSSVEIGDPGRLIVEAAERLDADLIALGTRGRGHLSRLAMGSVAERVVRWSQRPVLTLHQT